MEDEKMEDDEDARILKCKVYRSVDGCDFDEDDMLSTVEIRVNSSVLARKSTYFNKLLNAGMKESSESTVIIKISDREEEPFTKMVKWMQSEIEMLTGEESLTLLNIVKSADKFQVPSCITQCCEILVSRAMTIEVATACLWMDSSEHLLLLPCILEGAKKFILENCKNIDRYEGDIIELPPCGIEMLLSSDILNVRNERSVLDLAVSWVKNNFKELKERRVALKGLLKHIRFAMMSAPELRNLLQCKEIGHDIIMESLFNKIEGGPILIQRSYKIRPVQVMELRLPHPSCTVYWDVRLDQLKEMMNGEKIETEAFRFNNYGVSMFLEYYKDKDKKMANDFMGMMIVIDSGSAPYCIEYDVCYRVNHRSNLPFWSLLQGKYTGKNAGNSKIGRHKVVPWNDLVASDRYMTDETIYFRATFE